MPNHGGARPGSGPKPKPDAMVKRMYVLRQDQVDWLALTAKRVGVSRSEVIRVLIERNRMPGEGFRMDPR